MQKSCFLYDALSFTSKIHSPEDIIGMLGLGNLTFEPLNGAHGYRDRWYYDGISIHYNGREDMGVWCEMMGSGCRAFESFGHGDFDKIFRIILMHGDEMNITRLDVAFDDHEQLLDIRRLADDTNAQYFVSDVRTALVEHSVFDDAYTIYLGSKKSDYFLRIYDKAKERGFDDRHWVRLEFQLRRVYARQFIIEPGTIDEKFMAALNQMVRYVEPNGDSNKRRWPMADYWANFIDGAGKIKLFVRPGVEYNEHRLHHYIMKQAGGSLRTYLALYGEKTLINDIRKDGSPFNPRHLQLLRKKGILP